jgi:hypothetical protein
MARTVADVREALSDMREALIVDGYELEIAGVEPGHLALRLEALEHACADCLVPPGMMIQMVSAKLGGDYAPEAISIDYPEGSAAAGH